MINLQIAANGIRFPENWDLSSLENVTRYPVIPDTTEYKFVSDKFLETLPSSRILGVERIQNRRKELFEM